MRLVYLFICMMISIVTFAQNGFERSIDEENGSVVFNGGLGFSDLMQEPTFIWFQKGIESYIPNAEAVETLKNNLREYKLVVLIGTWCEDSQNLIPKLYTTLLKADYDVGSVKIIGVDRMKEAKERMEKPYSIEKVPTIIVYKNEKEVGRIIEVVKQSIETDLADIISKSSF